MPKFPKILRSFKPSSSSVSGPSKAKDSNKIGIFRRQAKKPSITKKNDGINEEEVPAIIVPTITFSLSEDESSAIHSPVSDIENQVQELPGESINEFVVGPDETIFERRSMPEMREISVGTEDNDTMTFTYLEIMRNELNQMMALANKDKEIAHLNQVNDNLKKEHADEIASKDMEIATIQKALQEVEATLSRTDNELSKTIEVLMKTQYELYELQHSRSSWITPLWSYFDMN